MAKEKLPSSTNVDDVSFLLTSRDDRRSSSAMCCLENARGSIEWREKEEQLGSITCDAPYTNRYQVLQYADTVVV